LSKNNYTGVFPGNLPSTPVSFGDESPVSAHLLKRGRRTSGARPRNVAAPNRGLRSGYTAMSNVVNRAGVRLLRPRTLFGLFMAGPALYMVYGIWYMVYGIWYMVYGIWYLVFGIWYMVYGIGLIDYGLWFMSYRNMG